MKSFNSYYNRMNDVKLFAVGDALLSERVYSSCHSVDDYKKILSNLQPYIDKCDLKYYNQESIIGGDELGLRGSVFTWVNDNPQPTFNSPRIFGDAMVECGFNLISLANNHTLDMNSVGVYNSCQYWRKKNVITSGSSLSPEGPKIFEENGIKFGFVAYTNKLNGKKSPDVFSFWRNEYNRAKVAKDVSFIKQNADVAIVSLHWDYEYQFGPHFDTIEEAKYLASLGVDIVLGGHSHNIHPMTFIDKTIVVFSMGNFIACQHPDLEQKRVGAMYMFDIHKDENEIHITPSADLFYINHDENFQNFKLETQKTKPNIIDWDSYYLKVIPSIPSFI